MDTESIFFTLFVIWYFSRYLPKDVINTLYILHNQANDFLNIYNSILNPLYFSLDEEEIIQEASSVKPKIEFKYEDKFLEDIRKMKKEFEFNEEEKIEEEQKLVEFMKKTCHDRVNEISKINEKMTQIEMNLTKYKENDDDDDYYICGDEDDGDINLCETKEERIKTLIKQQVELINEKIKLEELYSSVEYQAEELQKKEDAKNFIINKRLDKLENCYVMEFTPLGNVLMQYDKNKESFKFYSDNIIPYRYLEVVGRKFVKQFNCRPIFVDMEEELKLAEEKWEKERKEKEQKEEEEKRRKEEAIKNQTPVEEKKKNVFAKFKSYNKESGSGHVITVAPPKNSIPNKKMSQSQENEKILLKQKANRYTYEGKMANFSFIKKIDRKVVDKKFGMSFADFKKSILKK